MFDKFSCSRQIKKIRISFIFSNEYTFEKCEKKSLFFFHLKKKSRHVTGPGHTTPIKLFNMYQRIVVCFLYTQKKKKKSQSTPQ
ncbi:hypothetical protein MIMGU_mgv11b014465mg [Erythranthe guttata]|uniref:Uncharacterized protein n=1 Tax=Erythranthe guttata TaxID=4155 RepID=A0A022R9X7_ERYGU|nr:hypothetical protein MIMGU_mgv11b014465mg [Erythranthe guttata]